MKYLPALAISFGMLYLGSLVIALCTAVFFETLTIVWTVK